MMRIFNATGQDLAFLADELSAAFHDHCRLEKARLKAKEKQLRAEKVLARFPRPRGREKALLVTDCDLTAEGMKFVFGMASPRDGVAVVSTRRLGNKTRISKEAVHEVGHLFFLNHCKLRCVMSFSNSLAEADKKPKALCRDCRALLRTQRFLL